MSRRCRRRGEDGVAVVVAVALTALLGLVAVIGVGVGGLVAAHRRAAAAADLAALAAATARERGEDPCAAAQAITERNGAELGDCAVTPGAVEVTTRLSPRGLLGVEVRGRARAGP